nr:signal peptidase I [Anaerotignum lactatifermentans]
MHFSTKAVYFCIADFSGKNKGRRSRIQVQETIKEWGQVILRAAVVLLILFYFCWPVRILGSSMEPTYSDGNILCFSRITSMTGNYHRGDVVVFDYYAEGERQTVLKRIIAMGGDTIQILTDGVYVNGEQLEEPYILGETTGIADMTVPEGTVFVMGDHRDTSFDSRNMGVISMEDLKGKVIFSLFPPGKAK